MPQAETHRGIAWPRLFAEGAAIVISILLAFAIDAWWDSRGEAVEERGHLEALLAQFESAESIIRDERASIEDAAEATRRLLGLSVATAVSMNPDSIAVLFTRTFSVGRANLPSGALDALMASGDLRLIDDRGLATGLAAWPSLVAEVYENAGWLIEYRDRAFTPFFHEYVGGLWTTRPTGLLAGYPDTRYRPRVEALFSDMRLEGHLSMFALRLALLRVRYGVLAERARAIRSSIERSLGR